MATERDESYAYPELLADLAAQIGEQLVEHGIHRDRAAEIGLKTAEFIRGHWSGQPIYIPKGVAYDFSRRDLAIFEKFNGRNHAPLAREYNLSVMRIYQIVKSIRAEMIRKNQGALF